MIASLAPYYLYFKFFHVFFVLMWSMSAVGAYIFYLRATIYEFQKDPENRELEKRLVWAYEQFDKTVILEHIAFPIVLITGLLMYFAAGWTLESPWMLIKLAIVFGFFLPLEILDVWISHVLGPRISRNRDSDPNSWDEGRALHWKFLKVSAPMIRITVPTVIFLAVVKPTLW